MNKHKILTIQDIVNVVNETNIKNFIIDFNKFLESIVVMKKLVDAFHKGEPIDIEDFIWIDDNKNDFKIRIKPKKEI